MMTLRNPVQPEGGNQWYLYVFLRRSDRFPDDYQQPLQDMPIRQCCLWSSASLPLIRSIYGDLSDQTIWIFSGLLPKTKNGMPMPRQGGFPGSRPRISTIFPCIPFPQRDILSLSMEFSFSPRFYLSASVQPGEKVSPFLKATSLPAPLPGV